MSVRQSLLILLAERDRHGYQLRQEFEQRTGGTWPINIGQIYTTLNRLQRDGLVTEAGRQDDGSVVYRLTDAGRQEAALWWATPVDRATPSREELAIKLALAITSPGIDVRTVLQSQRTESLRALQTYTGHKSRLPAKPEGSALARLLVLDNLIFAVDAEVRWLDHLERQLSQTPSRPASGPEGADPDHLRGGPPSGGGLADPLQGSPDTPSADHPERPAAEPVADPAHDSTVERS